MQELLELFAKFGYSPPVMLHFSLKFLGTTIEDTGYTLEEFWTTFGKDTLRLLCDTYDLSEDTKKSTKAVTNFMANLSLTSAKLLAKPIHNLSKIPKQVLVELVEEK